MVGKLDLEGGTLIFLDTETRAGTLGADSKATVQQSLRQRKHGRALTIAIGGQLLFADYLIICIAQLHLQRLVADGGLFSGRQFFPYNGSDMDGLARTVDATVGKQADMFLVIGTFVIRIASITARLWTILVGGGIGKG